MQENQKSEFKRWLERIQLTDKEDTFTVNTITSYIGALNSVSKKFAGAISPNKTIFEITNMESFQDAVKRIESDEKYKDFNKNTSKTSPEYALKY